MESEINLRRENLWALSAEERCKIRVRREHKTCQGKPQDLPGETTRLARRNHKTCQKKPQDLPGETTRLARRNHKTYQEKPQDLPGETTRLTRKKHKRLARFKDFFPPRNKTNST